MGLTLGCILCLLLSLFISMNLDWSSIIMLLVGFILMSIDRWLKKWCSQKMLAHSCADLRPLRINIKVSRCFWHCSIFLHHNFGCRSCNDEVTHILIHTVPTRQGEMEYKIHKEKFGTLFGLLTTYAKRPRQRTVSTYIWNRQ